MSNPTNTRRPTSHIAPFGVRMQPDLKARLEGAATASGRSLNAEIVDRLERSFYETPLAGLSIEDVQKVTEQVIKSLYTDFIPRPAAEPAPTKPVPRRAPSAPDTDRRDLAGSESFSTAAPTRRAPKPKG